MDEKYEERKQKMIKEINEEIDETKSIGYTGTINIKNIEERLYLDKDILPTRSDIKKVNEGQYKIIYDKDPDNDLEFEIEPNKPFYEDSDEFKNKKLLNAFLDKSKKVYINPDMSFIPFRFKQDDKFYILISDNDLEVLELYRLDSLIYINKQHNVHYIIETNMDTRFKGKLKDFEIDVIIKCKRCTNYNSTILYNVYKKIDNFKKEPALIKQYK
ncbi:hypothetical protein [Methanobacterium sp.]|uniref:hypothetical protein n=1 Tax=Methanobacterium sp. TaxID=2164 RepID=UPI003158C4F3